MKKGDVRTEDLGSNVMALQWMDKKVVTMLTNIHENEMVSKNRRSRFGVDHIEQVDKPVCIDQYNQFMGGVDKSDQLLSYYGFHHKTIKWSTRASFHLLDLAIVNSYILYKLSEQDKKHKTHIQYRIELAKHLLLEAGISSHTIESDQNVPLPCNRLTGRHFHSKIPLRENGKQSQRECVVCSYKNGNTRKTSIYACANCNVALCVVPCFELYHTRKDPQRYL